MGLLFFQLCKSSQFLILLAVSSAIVIVDAGARNSWTDQSNSTSASNESEVMQIDEFPPATDDGLKALDWSTVWPYFNTGCLEWLPINHVYFQLANSFLFLSYLAPAGLYGLIYLRLTLAIGSAFLSIWGWIIICAFDTFLWNALFFVINAVHAVVLIISLRPVALDEQVEQVYRNLFKPLKVSKQQFKKVAKCVMSIRPIKRGEYFAVEQETAVETLSLLLSGIMLVIERGKTLYVLSPMQFLDSPDWFDDSCDHIYQESIQACEESRVLLWHRDKLQAILHKDLFLQSVFNQILGRDVVHKLSETSRNTNIVKAKGFSELNGSTKIENEKSSNGKPSGKLKRKSGFSPDTFYLIAVVNDALFEGKENTAKRDQQALEQLSLLNETVTKNVTYSLNNKRQFSR
ncbi:hypothetical protein DAPPUDRAFT_302399 [Daphnia pulex]|uniref:POPDC1-3 domain-containing protein n=1 Tax=Daphnia pulex TaxID=6669 RepID=E9GDB0_DAPPU|nr:hypothetical protein DAPPUDRAFT_302399 [Daphnia pulex]|eukprot:EFX82708.1 hypothetical protein DAPPUDRAFT_302399 [Daphnia pulex]